MQLETKDTLHQETIDAVQELIQINIDSYNGARQAAQQVGDTALQGLFSELAQERIGQAVALQKLVFRNEEEPITEGTVAARIHRAIMDWRAAFGNGPIAVLKEAERGEDYIKAKYETVLTQTAGSAVTDVLNRQYAAVKRAHDRIRDLRDDMIARKEEDMQSSSKTIGQRLDDGIDAARKTAEKAGTKVRESASDALEAAGGKFQDVGRKLKNSADAAGDAISDGVECAGDTLEGLGGKAKSDESKSA